MSKIWESSSASFEGSNLGRSSKVDEEKKRREKREVSDRG